MNRAPDGVGDGGDGGFEMAPRKHNQLPQRGALDEVADRAVELLVEILVAEDGLGEVIQRRFRAEPNGLKLLRRQADHRGGVNNAQGNLGQFTIGPP